MKPIAGFEGRYSVTDDGRIWSHARKGRATGGWLRLHADKNGYQMAYLFDGSRLRSTRVARAKAERAQRADVQRQCWKILRERIANRLWQSRRPPQGAIMIDIKNLDKAAVLAALYNASKPQGMSILSFKPGEMGKSEATELLKTQTYFDYLHGRVMKVNLSKSEFREELYDRDNGPGAAYDAIKALIAAAQP